MAKINKTQSFGKRILRTVLSFVFIMVLLLLGCMAGYISKFFENHSDTTKININMIDSSIESNGEIEENGDIERTDSSIVKKSYDEATNLTVDNLIKNSLGSYSYGDLQIVESDREWIESSLNNEGTVEHGALYRSLATQIEGYSFIGYDSWKRSIVPILFGFDKPASKDELNPYIESVNDYIVLNSPLKSVMNKLATLSCVEGTINTETGEYDFIITDLTQASEEMQITEQALGYILAMIDEYGATIKFENNSYSCVMKNPVAE